MGTEKRQKSLVRLATAGATPVPADTLIDSDIRRLPAPFPLDLTRIPFLLSAKRITPHDVASGRAYENRQVMQDPATGSRFEVHVSTDRLVYLPYGADGSLLLAVLKIADEIGLREPVWVEPSQARIAEELERSDGGAGIWQQIRDGLRRLAAVSIRTSLIYRPQQIALDILEGREGAHPIRPPWGRPPNQREVVGARIMKVEFEEDHSRRLEGELWIRRIEFDPTWFEQAVAGWVAWVDMRVYRSLRGNIARRMHLLLAGEAARGRPPAWVFTLGELEALCGLIGARKNQIRERVEGALDQVTAAGILAGRQSIVEKRKHRYVLEPGPALTIAGSMRGLGMADGATVRQLQPLALAFGASPSDAREMATLRPELLYDLLTYLAYARDVGKSIRNTGAWLRKAFTEEFNVAGEREFLRWREKRRKDRTSRRGLELVLPTHVALPPALKAPAPPEPEPVSVPPSPTDVAVDADGPAAGTLPAAGPEPALEEDYWPEIAPLLTTDAVARSTRTWARLYQGTARVRIVERGGVVACQIHLVCGDRSSMAAEQLISGNRDALLSAATQVVGRAVTDASFSVDKA